MRLVAAVHALQMTQQNQSSTAISSSSSPAAAPAKQRSLLAEFVLGASASMSACLFTNPMETVKTRMQVQGELKSTKGASNAVGGGKPYSNALQAFYVIGRNEGWRGLQGGLGPALLYQLAMNGTRLGFYDPLKRFYTRLLPQFSEPGKPNTVANVCAGATAGMCGAFVGSPFFLVKVRLQVQAKTTGVAAAVGHQHAYTSASSALKEIYNSDGVRGLFRGVHAAMLRVATGSSVQLSSYDVSKQLVSNGLGMSAADPRTHFLSSLIAGFFVTLAMNPPDVISTRLYNQPVVNGKGQLYSGLFDCIVKTARSEGLRGLYKGFPAHYLRLGPHTVLTFVFWEQLKKAADRLGF